MPLGEGARETREDRSKTETGPRPHQRRVCASVPWVCTLGRNGEAWEGLLPALTSAALWWHVHALDTHHPHALTRGSQLCNPGTS